jgi:hypothetical protein
MGEMINEYNNLISKPQGKRLFGKTLAEMGVSYQNGCSENCVTVGLDSNGSGQEAFVNTVMNLCLYKLPQTFKQQMYR